MSPPVPRWTQPEIDHLEKPAGEVPYASCNAAAKELHVSQAGISLAIRQVRPVAVLGLSFEALRSTK